MIKCIYTNRESKQGHVSLFMGKTKEGKGQFEDILWAPLFWEGQHKKKKGQFMDKHRGGMIKKMGKCKRLINSLTQSLPDYFKLRAFLPSNDKCQSASTKMFFSPPLSLSLLFPIQSVVFILQSILHLS